MRNSLYLPALFFCALSAQAQHGVGINLAHLNPECQGQLSGNNTFQISCPEHHPGYQLQTQLSPHAALGSGETLDPVALWISMQPLTCSENRVPPAPAQRLSSDAPLRFPNGQGLITWHFCVQSKHPVPAVMVDVVPLSEIDLAGVRVFDVQFSHNDDSLSLETQQQILSFLNLSHDLSQYRVELHGHASAAGTEDENQRLSQRRVAAVRAFLLMKSPWRDAEIQEGAFGERRPAYLVPSPQRDPREGWNRRVNIVLIPITPPL